MRREIKFRAWNGKKSDMVLLGDLTEANWDIRFIFKHYQIMQYTGLKDCHGNDIFEGDILSYYMHNESINALVEFKEGAFMIRDGHSYTLAETKKQALGGLEIIGNIYENPELLK